MSSDDDRLKDMSEEEVDIAGTNEQDDSMISANIDDKGDEVPFFWDCSQLLS